MTKNSDKGKLGKIKQYESDKINFSNKMKIKKVKQNENYKKSNKKNENKNESF